MGSMKKHVSWGSLKKTGSGRAATEASRLLAFTSAFRVLAGGASISHSNANTEPFEALHPTWRKPQHRGALGSNTKGSSLPHRSGVPDCRNLAVRAFCRWQAS